MGLDTNFSKKYRTQALGNDAFKPSNIFSFSSPFICTRFTFDKPKVTLQKSVYSNKFQAFFFFFFIIETLWSLPYNKSNPLKASIFISFYSNQIYLFFKTSLIYKIWRSFATSKSILKYFQLFFKSLSKRLYLEAYHNTELYQAIVIARLIYFKTWWSVLSRKFLSLSLHSKWQ